MVGARRGIGQCAALTLLVAGAAGAQSAAPDSVLAGIFTTGQALRGDGTFRRACSACHETGEFSGGRFRLTWSGRSVGDLYETISTLMPEADPGSLSALEYGSLVAYLLHLNAYPPGDVELSTNIDELRRIQIVDLPAP